MHKDAVLPPKVRALLDRGVSMPLPATVEVAGDVDPLRIAPGCVIHPGCRLRGAELSVGPYCELGAEAPATVENCQLDEGVKLKGGFFSGATFLTGASMGSGAHVRPGTLLEEESGAAHAVGFKQTILLPWVTAGSLINFCDVLMAGGTSREDHSEVGSSYIHFNYTPHGDKATASMLGDVPRGVMLDRPRIFLGGQGGLVGPVRLGFGSVVPAGLVWREDAPEGGRLLWPAAADPAKSPAPKPFVKGAYKSVDRLVRNNLIYIGNLLALREWHRHARSARREPDDYCRWAHEGALKRIDEGLDERISRLGGLAKAMPASLELARAEHGGAPPDRPYGLQQVLADQWPRMREELAALRAAGAPEAGRDAFLSHWIRLPPDLSYLDAVRSLSPEARAAGTAWLQSLADAAAALWSPIG